MLIFQQTGRIPRQIVVYVGRAKMRMPVRIEHPKLKFEYILLDIRTIDAAPLIASGEIEANIIGFLCGNGATRENLRRILRNLCRFESNRRKDALAQLAALAGLRVKQEIFVEEAIEMGLQADIQENLIFRGFYNDGVQVGEQKGESKLLRMLLQTKFGKLPKWALEYLQTAQTSELEAASLRLLKASTLEEVLRAPESGATKKKQSTKSANGTAR
jgi:hypothetical protein